MAQSSDPPARSLLGPAFSLVPSMDARRAKFAAMFTPNGAGYAMLHKGHRYRLTDKQYHRCHHEFEEIVAEVRARFTRSAIQMVLGSVIVIPVYFGFIDSLLTMLPTAVQNGIDTFMIFQPVMWGVGLGVWQERRIAALVDDMAQRMAGRSTSTNEDMAQYTTDRVGSIVVQAVVVAAVALILFGGALF